MKEFIKNSDVFFRFIDDILMQKDREVVLNKLVESIRDYLSADRCTLFIYDRINNELVSRVAQGADEVRLPADGSSLSSYCFMTGETRFTNDAYSEKKLRAIENNIQVSSKWDEKHHYRTESALVTPIIARGERIGVFLAMNKPGGFIDSSVDGVIEFVSLLGLAVEIVLLDEALKNGKSMDTLPF
ncbi:MAG: GAF domain-containing protein [Mariprofundaceae bacterium]|nr:GAF domain-containing protein [Mariprofundaceae bacterium]